jgi:hypothetical protein
MRLPQGEGGSSAAAAACHFSPLLDLENGTAHDVRLELLSPEGDAWEPVLPLVPAGSRWALARATPLWLPRVKAVRVVRVVDGAELWRRAPFGDGGRVTLPPSSSP